MKCSLKSLTVQYRVRIVYLFCMVSTGSVVPGREAGDNLYACYSSSAVCWIPVPSQLHFVEALKLAYEQKLCFWQQFFGFGFIESGSSILAEYQSGSRVLMNKTWKKIYAGNGSTCPEFRSGSKKMQIRPGPDLDIQHCLLEKKEHGP